jgi:chromosome segregation ATPase
MTAGKCKNRNQGYLESSEPNSPTITSPGYSTTPEKKKKKKDLKSLLIMMMEDFKDKNNSLKEVQDNTGKQVETLEEETQKYLKELQENIAKQVKELNKTIQDLKMEVETIKKSQRETTLEIENLGKRSGVIDASTTNRIQGIEERISGAKDTIENIDTTIKENAKCKKILTQNIQEIKDKMGRLNLRIIGLEERQEFQLKGPVNIFNKIIEENFPNLKKELPTSKQEAYRTPNMLDQKRNSSHHIIIKTPNAQNKERILEAVREKGQVKYKGRPIRITPNF